MQGAALYDIHGNLPALESVLEELQRITVDQIVVGGDVLSGPMQPDCMERLQALSLPVHFLKGNADREVMAARHGDENKKLPRFALEMLRWSARQLTPTHEKWLASWPKTVTLGSHTLEACSSAMPPPATIMNLYLADCGSDLVTDIRRCKCGCRGLRPHSHAILPHGRQDTCRECR